MGLHPRLFAFTLLVLLAACAAPAEPAEPRVVLVHASDPHLLDAKNPDQEKLNQFAFADMMDTLRRGLPRVPRPRILVVTGDFGLEVTDPLFTIDTSGAVHPPNPARARRRREEVANIVASEINGSPFQKVYFVAGNNDVFAENAEPRAWSEVDTFVTRVQARLKNREIRDLTACYHRAGATPADCIARLDSPYALVGFPTVSFKNAELKAMERRQLMLGADSVWLARNPSRVLWQDSLHMEMLRRFREVLSEATAGGWRAIVATHIPDLEDPYYAGRRAAASRTAAAQPPSPASTAAPPASPAPVTRLSPPDRDDAWNASPAVFAEWKALVEWPRVRWMLAGHFHDSDRSTYRRPYPWSDRQPWADTLPRVDRCRIFVAPPLALKNQEKSAVGARGFALVTLRNDRLQRDLYWYDRNRRSFARDPGGDVVRDSAGERCRPAPATAAAVARPRRQDLTINPLASGQHLATFALTLVLAPLALVFWAAGRERRSAFMRWLWERRTRTAEAATRLGGTPPRSMLLTGTVGASDLVLVRLAWDNWNLVLSALIWFVVLLALLIAAVRLRAR